MSERRGVLSAGTWCVDFNKSIARWPDEDTSNEVLAIDRQNGGSGSNMALDLKRLDPDFPVEAMGVVGDDDLGRFLFAECDARGVNRIALRARRWRRDDERRRLQCRGQRPAHPFLPSGRGGRDDARRLRLLFDHGKNPASWIARRAQGDGPAVAWRGQRLGCGVAQGARHGLSANLELMTTRADRLAELGRPCLPYLDYLIVNDYEIGALAGARRGEPTARPTRPQSRGRSTMCSRSARCNGLRLTFLRAPSWADATDRGLRWAQSLCRRAPLWAPTARATLSPPACCMGCMSNGRLLSVLQLGHACAAASMRAVSTTAGVGTVGECRALAKKWGFRPLALDTPERARSVSRLVRGGSSSACRSFRIALFSCATARRRTTPKTACRGSSISLSTLVGASRRARSAERCGAFSGARSTGLMRLRRFFASPLERARETMEIARDAMGLDAQALPPRRSPERTQLRRLGGADLVGDRNQGSQRLAGAARGSVGLRARGGESYAMLADRLSPGSAA